MQKMASALRLHPSYSETEENKFVQDFWLKLKLMQEMDDATLQKDIQLQTLEEKTLVPVVVDDELKFHGQVVAENNLEKAEEEEEDDDDDDEDFSFSRAFGRDSLISAEEAFLDGQIRPVFPLFDQDLLLSDAHPEGPHCEWRGKSTATSVVAEASLGGCKKSNSTGFSKLRRFRELVLRSNSDGKDKFAFLNNQHSPDAAAGTSKRKKVPAKNATAASMAAKLKKKENKAETASSAFEKNYLRRKEEGGKRLSYLPYKQVGFFASVNGLSKNVHPY